MNSINYICKNRVNFFQDVTDLHPKSEQPSENRKDKGKPGGVQQNKC